MQTSSSTSILNEQLTPLPFSQTNPLLCRNTPPSHKICQLLKPEKNLELLFIILAKHSQIQTKNSLITQCLVAD